MKEAIRINGMEKIIQNIIILTAIRAEKELVVIIICSKEPLI